jgi:hypothetical protein
MHVRQSLSIFDCYKSCIVPEIFMCRGICSGISPKSQYFEWLLMRDSSASERGTQETLEHFCLCFSSIFSQLYLSEPQYCRCSVLLGWLNIIERKGPTAYLRRRACLLRSYNVGNRYEYPVIVKATISVIHEATVIEFRQGCDMIHAFKHFI